MKQQIIYQDLSLIHPYEKNPRKNDGAVAAVAESIQEFGFKVPVIVDRNNVIIAGHTRYKAALQLGLDQIPCIVAEDLNDGRSKHTALQTIRSPRRQLGTANCFAGSWNSCRLWDMIWHRRVLKNLNWIVS